MPVVVGHCSQEVVSANVLVTGFAHMVPDWHAASPLTRWVCIVLHDEGYPVYFVVEFKNVHIVLLSLDQRGRGQAFQR